MPLTPGTRLGPYEIVAPLGAGGMGEVFRATDTRLGREVAIKVLPQHLSDNPEVRARFEREAKTVSSLNHPHICTLHDVGREGDTDYLVMELVDGETLAQRLEKGALPPAEALKLGGQIADALDRAHRAGVVHRDLKPGNVMLTKSGAKLMDFGLARATGMAGPASGSGVTIATLTQSPTVASPLTAEGTIVGTFQYMAPEQLEGSEADARSDLWALGCVLYEMATGKRAFEGKSQASLISSIMGSQPASITQLAPMSPPGLDRLVQACLAKDPADRLQSAHDIRMQLAWLAEGGSQAGVPAPVAARRRSRERLAWMLAAAALIVAVALAWITLRPGGPEGSFQASSSEWRTSLALPDGVGIPTLGYNGSASRATLALSPRGDRVAFVGLKDGEGALYLRRFDSFDTVRLTKTEGAAMPFFSPDGTRLAFFARGRLWRIDLPDGVPVELTSSSGTSVGGSWGDDGQIVYAPNYADAIWTIPATGGEARPLTTVDRAGGEVSHRWPCVLPGGAGVLFTIKTATSETLDDALIAVADAKTGDHRVLIEGGSMPRYLDDGHLVFARAGKLYAVAFDLTSRDVRGAPVSVLDDVATMPTNGAAFCDVTREGLLAYVAGGPRETTGRYSWEGPGHPGQILDRLDPRLFGTPRLSRDFKQAVVQVAGANDKIWLIDLEQMNATRVTSGGGNDASGVISPDGRWLLFSSDRAGGGYRFYRMPLGGGAEPESLLVGKGRIHSISYQARMLGFTLFTPGHGADACVVAIADDGTPAGKPALVAGGPENQFSPTVSADGTLVAYVSTESGRGEVYVTRLADPGVRRRLTNEGGENPLWSRDGSRLFYSSSGRVVSQALRSVSELRFDSPQAVSGSETPGEIAGFDVAPDGSSALIGRVADPLMLCRDIRLWPGWGATLPGPSSSP
jgi:Tol biopolymer transport system component/tRNA A-37 threonylcarbamoyl transferase component Bud32